MKAKVTNMKTSQRILLVLFCLLFIAVITVAALLLCGAFGTDTVSGFIASVAGGNYLLAACVIMPAVLLIIIAFLMMFLGTKKLPPAQTLIKATENGDINISIATLNMIALKTVRTVSGVRDAKAFADVNENGVQVTVKVAVLNDSIIPDVCTQVQQAVKEKTESCVGLQISSVKVLVDNTIAANAN